MWPSLRTICDGRPYPSGYASLALLPGISLHPRRHLGGGSVAQGKRYAERWRLARDAAESSLGTNGGQRLERASTTAARPAVDT